MYTLSEQGHTVLLTEISRANRHARIRRLSKDEYINLRTGDIKEYENHADNRTQNRNSLFRTFSELRALINTNCHTPNNVLWITLTYKENMTDTKQLKKDFNNYWKRFIYYCKKNGIPRPEYIATAEPQKRGAWHWHILIIWQHRRPYIPNKDIEEIWGNGYTKTKALNNSDNVAGYLCCYLMDLPIDDETAEGKISHKIDKGGRLELYPNGFHFYRYSRGIQKPSKYEITEAKAEQFRATYEMTYKTETTIKDDRSGYATEIIKEWYRI